MSLVIYELKGRFRGDRHPDAKPDRSEWTNPGRVRGIAKRSAAQEAKRVAEALAAASSPAFEGTLFIYGLSEQENPERNLLAQPLLKEEGWGWEADEAKARFSKRFSVADLSPNERPKFATWHSNGLMSTPFHHPAPVVGDNGHLDWCVTWLDRIGAGQSELDNRRFEGAWAGIGYLDGDPSGLGFAECAARVEAFLREEMPGVPFVGPAEAIALCERLSQSDELNGQPNASLGPIARPGVRRVFSEVRARLVAQAEQLDLRACVLQAEAPLRAAAETGERADSSAGSLTESTQKSLRL